MDTWKPEKFEDLYERFFKPVFNYIFLRVRNRAEAEDLAQAVFVKAYQANPPNRPGQELALNYFFTVARNAIIDHWRKKKDSLMGDEEDVFENIPDDKDPEDDAMRKESKNIIQEALKKIRPSESEVLILKFINELSTKEIAGILGKTELAVRQLQSRGLKALRENLKETEI